MRLVFKTSVSLDGDVLRDVKRRSKRTDVPVSRLVNSALRDYLSRLAAEDRGPIGPGRGPRQRPPVKKA